MVTQAAFHGAHHGGGAADGAGGGVNSLKRPKHS